MSTITCLGAEKLLPKVSLVKKPETVKLSVQSSQLKNRDVTFFL